MLMILFSCDEAKIETLFMSMLLLKIENIKSLLSYQNYRFHSAGDKIKKIELLQNLEPQSSKF